MLPDKETWAKKFVGSAKYKKILEAIHNFNDPSFIPVWNHRDGWRQEEKRQRVYLHRVLPLQSFYILDYIDKQTKGGTIVNLCEGLHMFAGMYNVVSCKDFFPSTSSVYELHDLNKKFDNVFSVCGYSGITLDEFERFLIRFARLTNNYGYIAVDSFEIVKRTNNDFVNSNELFKYYKLILFFDGIVERLSKRVDIIDYENHIELEPEYPDNSYDAIDGDIRILFKVKPSTKA